MNRINKGAKIGLMIEMFAGIIMAILVIVNKPIPTVVAWLFGVGVVIALASSLKELKK
ncbi:hypothetical protein [Proteiniborus sp. MB09-C3]|uniref:hypothetical protein n=1 Tax=Proteiniborus sp. MB09-C3 TaxID=3050072 RepID=UPI0025558361|nr:hypothetical protein [Proteiniborus sp. MB09-C3]WIV10559.1 hypothetical protein QO263_10345 [Proteiniborus sp. MB09-C3]